MSASPSERRFVVFIPEPFPEQALEVLGPGFEVRQGRIGKAYTEAELMTLLVDVDAVATNSRDSFTRRVIEGAPRLRVIAKAGSKPSSNVDMAAAERRGVRVTWTPGANAVSVAEMTMAMMLTVVRRLPEASERLRAGGWRSMDLLGNELAGRTLGLVGLGAVGREVARRFQVFGGRVLAFDPYVDRETSLKLGVEGVENLSDLYRRSHIVSLHCEMNGRTAHMIDAEALACMRPDAVLINTARGGLVDESALLDALEAGRPWAAALDVFENEPTRPEHPLLRHPRVFATPHTAAFTHEASLRESAWALEDAGRVLQGLEPVHLGAAPHTASCATPGP
ncbi:MAG TPA: hydroxyacid dehydrogenase [Caldimonas sp.]|jgi:D-3-phosphoglycerate dehydrogenase|nr:hydroxyacid dehydrogenase [Caldimonas sp.]